MKSIESAALAPSAIESKNRIRKLSRTKVGSAVLLLMTVTGAIACEPGCQQTEEQDCRTLPNPEPAFTGPEDAEHHVALAGDSIMFTIQKGEDALNPENKNTHLTSYLQLQGYKTNQALMTGAEIRDVFSPAYPFPGWPAIPETTLDGDDTELITVTGLGTNDLHFYYDQLGEFNQAGIDQASAHYNQYILDTDADCNVYVGVTEQDPLPEYGEGWGMGVMGPVFNDFLEQKAAAEGDVFVDWATISAAHPEYFAIDMVHLTESGRQAQGLAIVDGVEQCRDIIEAEDIVEGQPTA